MEKNYAQVLWKMIATGMQPKRAVRSLYEYLKSCGRDSLMPKIAHEFGRLAAKDEQRTGITLWIAREKDAAAGKRAVKATLAELDATAKDLGVRIDETLIGGWRLEGRETLIDMSFKKQLSDMYNRATAE